MARIKKETQDELATLKRKLTFRPTFDEVAARKCISNLKSKVSSLTSDVNKLDRGNKLHAVKG